MSASLDSSLNAALELLASSDRLRSCPAVSVKEGTHLKFEGPQNLLSFSSNDYLGLANHPMVKEAAVKTIVDKGVGAGASRLVTGDCPEHRDLEAGLAEHLGVEAALLFPSGYQANIGAVTALAGPDDLIVSDALNHASLIDGCRLSKATVSVFPHLDAVAAERCLQQRANPEGRPFSRKLLLTESVFSMDGDIAPIKALSAACGKAGAALIVDEAHALGVFGPDGQGVCAAEHVTPDLRIGTLGKAFGCSGGFVAGSHILRSYLVNRARTFIYTTGLPPAIAAAANASLRLIRGEEGGALRLSLQHLCTQLYLGLGLVRPWAPIIPWVLGTEAAALATTDALKTEGLFVQAIRPPTVPAGTSRLRITVSAMHQPSDIEKLLRCLKKLPQRVL